MHNIIYEGEHDKRKGLYLFAPKYTEGSEGSLHFHRSFEISYIVDGDMTVTVNDGTFHVTTDDIVFVQKFYTHHYGANKDSDKFVFIVPPASEGDFEKSLAHNTLPAHLSDKQFNRTLLPIIESMYSEIDTMPKLVKQGYLNVVIGKLISHYPLEPITTNSNIDLLIKILNYIDDNYAKDLSLDTLSAAFGYNKYYFSKLFNRYIGENINNYINITRLQKLMEYARKSSDVNITELAFDFGFDSLSTFYRCFNKIYGASPKEILGKAK